jgi:hypothetical protein
VKDIRVTIYLLHIDVTKLAIDVATVEQFQLTLHCGRKEFILHRPSPLDGSRFLNVGYVPLPRSHCLFTVLPDGKL